MFKTKERMEASKSMAKATWGSMKEKKKEGTKGKGRAEKEMDKDKAHRMPDKVCRAGGATKKKK